MAACGGGGYQNPCEKFGSETNTTYETFCRGTFIKSGKIPGEPLGLAALDVAAVKKCMSPLNAFDGHRLLQPRPLAECQQLRVVVAAVDNRRTWCRRFQRCPVAYPCRRLRVSSELVRPDMEQNVGSLERNEGFIFTIFNMHILHIIYRGRG